MAQVIGELAQAKFAGAPLSFDRSSLARELSYDTRAEEFTAVLRAGVAHREGDSRAAPRR
jgi:hypothetical protein